MAESKQGLIFSEFRNRCGYEITLGISNKLIGSEAKLFKIERYLSTYGEKFESLDLQHFRESLYGLRFLLDQWGFVLRVREMDRVKGRRYRQW